MELLSNLAHGFGIALLPVNLFYAFVGALVGTLIGVLPGIGPMSGIALLIPISYGMNPTSAIILLAGVYYGAMYGGSTTSILLNTPGESSSVVTTLDGYQLARQGKAGKALATAAIGSFVAGTMSIVGLMIMAPGLAKFALRFGPPEYFALMVVGLTAVTSLGGKSMIKALLSTAFGLALSTIGIDLQTGIARFTFGIPSLLDGIDFLVVAIGLFAVAEVLTTLDEPEASKSETNQLSDKLWLTRDDWKQAIGPMTRGSILGFLVGVLPGAGATIASFMSYDLEKRIAKDPDRFGKGALEGIAGPEAANNAASGGAMVPLLTMGIPGSGTTAVMMGALMMFGIRPGPLLFEQYPDVVWGLIASMYVGNAMLLVLNLPLVGLFVRIIFVPRKILLPMVLGFSMLGIYSLDSNPLDLILMAIFGLIGYFMKKYDFPAAPVVLALVLGDLIEQAMRQSLTISDNDPTIFVTRPISAALLALAVLSLLSPLLKRLIANQRPTPMGIGTR